MKLTISGLCCMDKRSRTANYEWSGQNKWPKQVAIVDLEEELKQAQEENVQLSQRVDERAK